MQPIICFDVGKSHTGVAISYDHSFVEPLTTIDEKDFQKLIEQIKKIISNYHPDKIVLGIPNHGELVEYVTNLGQIISQNYPDSVVLYNEDQSSQIAQSHLKQLGHSVIKIKQREHQVSASVILSDYLDSNFF